MKILSAKNPKFSDATNTSIVMDIDLDGIGFVPFTASATDVEAHGRKLHADALAGVFGPIAPFVPKVKTPAEIDAETSAAAKVKIAKTSVDVLPDLITFVAGLSGTPKVLTDAAALIATEKVKVK